MIDATATRRLADAAADRSAPTPTIAELEQIWRKFKAVSVPNCAAAYHQLISNGMSDTIQALIYYSSQAGDQLVRDKLRSAIDKLAKAKTERERIASTLR